MYLGIPRQPWIVWWSGDIAIYVADRDVIKMGVPCKILYFIPTESLIERYNIDMRDISEGGEADYSISEFGVVSRVYPRAHFLWLSYNPSNPVLLITCSFDGTDVMGEKIVELNNKIRDLEKTILSLRDECEKYRNEYKMALDRIRALEKMKSEEE
jgi:hypothetical protein